MLNLKVIPKIFPHHFIISYNYHTHYGYNSCTGLHSNHVHITEQLYCEKIQPCTKKSSLSWDTIILRETIIVHKKVVPSLLIKKQLYCKKAVMKLTITMNKKVNMARRVDG